MSNELKNLDDRKNQLAKHEHKLRAVRDRLRKERAVRMKRSAAIKAVAKASTALDAHFKYWAAPGFLQSFDPEYAPGIVLAATSVEEALEYHLAIELNNLCYIDQKAEEAGDYGSVQIIERTEAKWAACEMAVKERAKGTKSACRPHARHGSSPSSRALQLRGRKK